jgi:peptide/nickel transport system permease protein
MLGYVGRRLLHLLPVLLAVTLLTFLIASLLPGDLGVAILGDQATPEKLAALREQMGLDQPIAWRYLHWLGGVLQGDLGRSFRTGETVIAAIGARLPVSLELMLMAEIAGLLIGVPLGILCAVRQGGSLDRLLTGGAFGMLSVPGFLWAIVLIYLFAVRLNVLPATGWVPLQEDVVGNLRSFVLPALTLALGEWPVLMRVLRSDMIATLQEELHRHGEGQGAETRPHPAGACAQTFLAHARHRDGDQYRAADRRHDRGGDDLPCPASAGCWWARSTPAISSFCREWCCSSPSASCCSISRSTCFMRCSTPGSAMAALDAIADPATAPRRRSRVNRTFWAAAAWIALVLTAAVLANFLPIPSPTEMDMLARRMPPDAQHWLGTDGLGRDMLSRIVFGARTSLTIGFLSPLIGLAFGAALGMLAGYFRGKFETLAMAGMDVLLAFPPLVLVLAITAYLGQSVLNLAVTIGFLSIPPFARVARAATLTLAQRDFVTAARALGATHARILLRELLPNVLLPLLAFFLLAVAVTIVVEGALSFLGLGVPPPTPSWGSMIGEGRESLDIAPWLAFLPAGVLFLTVLAFNLIGDALRAMTDPRENVL